MLRFRIHDPKGPDGTGSAGAWVLRSAYLVGTDGRPTAGKVGTKGQTIVCVPERDQAVGLALLVDTGAAGRMVLQTCFLPQQDEPYELFVEIARWLIKQFILQSESWQMWNPLLSGEALNQWDSAREAFRVALREPDPLTAEGRARELEPASLPRQRFVAGGGGGARSHGRVVCARPVRSETSPALGRTRRDHPSDQCRAGPPA